MDVHLQNNYNKTTLDEHPCVTSNLSFSHVKEKDNARRNNQFN